MPYKITAIKIRCRAPFAPNNRATYPREVVDAVAVALGEPSPVSPPIHIHTHLSHTIPPHTHIFVATILLSSFAQKAPCRAEIQYGALTRQYFTHRLAARARERRPLRLMIDLYYAIHTATFLVLSLFSLLLLFSLSLSLES